MGVVIGLALSFKRISLLCVSFPQVLNQKCIQADTLCDPSRLGTASRVIQTGKYDQHIMRTTADEVTALGDSQTVAVLSFSHN